MVLVVLVAQFFVVVMMTQTLRTAIGVENSTLQFGVK
jgi:hypothetical protein